MCVTVVGKVRMVQWLLLHILHVHTFVIHTIRRPGVSTHSEAMTLRRRN